jgi:DNA-binding LacI/PurR family transcriptional regulator
VETDLAIGVTQVLDHLAGSGARRIAFLGESTAHTYSEDALGTYDRWIAARRTTPLRRQLDPPYTEAAAYAAATELLGLPDPPDAIVTDLERIAIGTLRAARDAGLEVPSQLRVASCIDSSQCRRAEPPVTALDVNPGRLAREAVTLLIELVEGRPPAPRHVLVRPTLNVRGSTIAL